MKQQINNKNQSSGRYPLVQTCLSRKDGQGSWDISYLCRIWTGSAKSLGQLLYIWKMDRNSSILILNSYIETYPLRDAVDDNSISNTDGFRKFLRACAAFSGRFLNYNDPASAAGISGATAKEWIRILQAIGIKKSASPSPYSIRTFSLLQKSEKKLGNGGIVCMTDKPIPITAENYMIPSNII